LYASLSFRTHASRFGGDERGSIAIMFGLMALTMVMFVGAAIDISRWLSARTDTLNAVDAAVLAGARALQTNSSDPQAAVASAKQFYDANTRNRLPVVDTIKFRTARNDTAFQASGSAEITTPFLGFAGVEKLPLIKLSAANSDSEFSEAVLKVGGNSGTNIEVSMMLDVTGSMEGDKLADMKVAAKDLIDIVVWQDQSQYTSRVALVPFSEAIRLDGNWAAEVASNGPASITFQNKSNKNTTYKLDPKCVTERVGTQALTDAAPNGLDKVGRFYDSNGVCNPASPTSVVPLTDDKVTLKSKIDAYRASGMTAGHLGTAWAWYMLSPNWAERVPPTSRPESYSLLTEKNEKGQPKLRKIAVLMTDGEYNTEYCSNGVTTDVMSCTLPNGNSAAQAAKLCTNMKAKGIDVYTVGFELGGNNSALNLLRNCASSTTHFYEAENGEQLKQAFRDIALKISTLYLTK
jgi:Flp pilus assembly protein TadG